MSRTANGKRILVVHPSLNPPGGGNGVAAWLLEALRDEHELTLLAWKEPQLEWVNDYFGTSLCSSDFEIRRVSQRARRLVDSMPVPGALLRHSLVIRQARSVVGRGAYDVVISTQNEMDFGRRGIQYIHFPEGYLPRPDCDLRWYHLPVLTTAYRKVCTGLAGSSREGIRRNVTLVNSDWTGRHVREIYGAATATVPPPVPGDFPDRPWSERADGFVVIGRISPEKELEKVIAILETVRGRGRDVRLHVVGSPDHPAYSRRIFDLVRRHEAWIELHLDISRRALVELVAGNRYGIHGMVGEHFGMAVAEIQRSGAVVFVPTEGGPAAIVGGDERLCYDGPEDAVQKIDRVLEDPDLRESIRRGVEERRDLYSAERFMSQVRDVVSRFG